MAENARGGREAREAPQEREVPRARRELLRLDAPAEGPARHTPESR